jgi:hypothetical protein
MTCEQTDKYQTYVISNPGRRERSSAGKAKRIRRVIELSNGGRVLPIPWNTLETVKTIPGSHEIQRYDF